MERIPVRAVVLPPGVVDDNESCLVQPLLASLCLVRKLLEVGRVSPKAEAGARNRDGGSLTLAAPWIPGNYEQEGPPRKEGVHHGHRGRLHWAADGDRPEPQRYAADPTGLLKLRPVLSAEEAHNV